MSILEDKLVRIFELIEQTCNSSVRRFNLEDGHSSRSVGFTAFEERQKRLQDLSEKHTDIIEFHCRKGGHNYFKFDGNALKIISSTRENLTPNVFEKNFVERGQDDLKCFDPLKRIIYKADYDIDGHEATILECYYLEIDRNTQLVIKEINILNLVKDRTGYISAVEKEVPEAVELPESNLLFSRVENKKDKSSE